MNLLSATILAPLFGVVLIWLWAGDSRGVARLIALASSIGTLVMAGMVVFDPTTWHGVDSAWLAGSSADSSFGLDVRWSLGLDGLSVWLFGLSALLTLTSVLVSWEAISDRAPLFYALMLLLETGMLGVFAARDIILFYVFFEFTLIPLFFLIGIWGHEERRYAAIKFFLFTLAGSLFTFLALVAIVLWDYYHSGTGVMTFSIPDLAAQLRDHPIDPAVQTWIFLGLFAGFAIKVPLFPLHTWLPLAHVQAPTAGSVLLAGVLLKIGAYGFVRFSLPMLPVASAAAMPWVLWLSVAGIIYGALVALAQSDLKKLIAYSSVSHLGFCMLGLFALNKAGLTGGMLQMINHGLSTGGLFAIVGMIYDRYHTREIAQFGGLAAKTPLLAAFMVFFTFSSIGLPGLNGFVGEFLLLLGMFQRGWTAAPAEWAMQWKTISVLAVSGVVLGAWYMLWLVERVLFGPLREPHLHDEGHARPVRDLSLREMAALVPLAVFMIWIGLAPGAFVEPMRSPIDALAVVTGDGFEEHYGSAPAVADARASAEVAARITQARAPLRPLSLWERVRVRAEAQWDDPSRRALTPALSHREREKSEHFLRSRAIGIGELTRVE